MLWGGGGGIHGCTLSAPAYRDVLVANAECVLIAVYVR